MKYKSHSIISINFSGKYRVRRKKHLAWNAMKYERIRCAELKICEILAKDGRIAIYIAVVYSRMTAIPGSDEVIPLHEQKGMIEGFYKGYR